MIICEGQKWRKKKNKKHVAVVNVVEIFDDGRGDIYLTMPWSVNGYGRKSLDMFLKQYELISDEQI